MNGHSRRRAVAASAAAALLTIGGVPVAGAQETTEETVPPTSDQATSTPEHTEPSASTSTPATSGAETEPADEDAEGTPSDDQAADAAEDAAKCRPLTVLVPIPSANDYEMPSEQPSGLFAEALRPVLADTELSQNVETISMPYKAKGTGEAGEVYSDSLTDGYARLTQVAHRVASSCTDSKIALLGQGQAGHLVSFFASEIGAGNAAIDANRIAFAATVSDPTRAAGQTLFPGVQGQSAPESWGDDPSSSSGWSSGTSWSSSGSEDDEDTTSITKYADLAKMPEGSGLNPEAQHIDDFGDLEGQVAQFCLTGDLSCAAPNNSALGRAGLQIMEHAQPDFTRDPLGSANSVWRSLSATAASGMARNAAEDWDGDEINTLAPTGEHSLSERLEDASAGGIRPAPTPGEDTDDEDKPTTVAEDSVTAMVRLGSIGVNALSTIAGDVLDEDTVGSLLRAGITGGATSPELQATLTTKAMKSAFDLIEPKSLGTRATSLFEAIGKEVTDNEDLPELIAAAQTWDQLTTQDAYKSTPVGSDGSSTTEILADWITAAARDLSSEDEEDADATESAEETTSSAPTTSSAAQASPGENRASATTPSPAPKPSPAAPARVNPTTPYVKDDDGNVAAAGPSVATRPAEAHAGIFTLADNEQPNWADNPMTLAEAGRSTVLGNKEYSIAQRLGFLADPAYPQRESPLHAIAVTGGLLPVAYGGQARVN